MVIKGIAIRKLGLPDLRGDDSQKFSRSQLWVLLLMLHGNDSFCLTCYSSNHSLDPAEHYFLSALGVGFRVEFEAMWEDIWRHSITIARGRSKYRDMSWVYGLHQYEYKSVLRLTFKHLEIFVSDLLA